MNIGIPELIVIFIVALLVIGPKKLPDVAQALGKSLAEFKRAMEDVKDNLHVDEVKKDIYDVKHSAAVERRYRPPQAAAGETPAQSPQDQTPEQTPDKTAASS